MSRHYGHIKLCYSFMNRLNKNHINQIGINAVYSLSLRYIEELLSLFI